MTFDDLLQIQDDSQVEDPWGWIFWRAHKGAPVNREGPFIGINEVADRIVEIIKNNDRSSQVIVLCQYFSEMRDDDPAFSGEACTYKVRKHSGLEWLAEFRPDRLSELPTWAQAISAARQIATR